MVSHQCQTLLLLSILAFTTIARASDASPKDAAIPSSLRQPGGSDRFYVGQRQLIRSSSSSGSSGGIGSSARGGSDENENNAWRYLNSDDDDQQNDSQPLNSHCILYHSLAKVICRQLEHKHELPRPESYFNSILHGVFLNTSSDTQIKLQDLRDLFPNLISLSITQSTTADAGSSETSFGHNHNNLLNEIFWLQDEAQYHVNDIVDIPPVESNRSVQLSRSKPIAPSTQNIRAAPKPPPSRRRRPIVWSSVKILNLSNNNADEPVDDDGEYQNSYRHKSQEYNSISISKILNVFPNLEQLELKGNRITTLKNITRQNQLKFIDISDNPLDCTTEEIRWLESSNITLLNVENTLCDRPPHQNRPKSILQTIRLIKKVQEECRVNCSCEIDYIWEQEKVIHSKTSVNCSSRNFTDFPDPDKLPHPTDTLYLNDNHIRSLTKFVYDNRYTNLNVMNLYLENNQISSLNELEQSDWIYNFQILSLRKNNLTEVHVHLLENIIRLNRWIYQIDLSDNNWHCECRTVSSFKLWLLQNYKFVKNIGNIKCGRTGREVRYLRNEDWCEIEQTKPFIEFLDILNIFMGLLIIAIIAKVMYDYWNLSRHGKVPWLVGKIW